MSAPVESPSNILLVINNTDILSRTISKLSEIIVYCRLQWDWLEALVRTQDVLKCITVNVITLEDGEPCVMIILLTQQQELFVALLDTGERRCALFAPCMC